jgi:hypothetical protein
VEVIGIYFRGFLQPLDRFMVSLHHAIRLPAKVEQIFPIESLGVDRLEHLESSLRESIAKCRLQCQFFRASSYQIKIAFGLSK